MNTPDTPHREDGHDRDLLAPIYGEAPTLASEDSRAFEATRDLVEDWMRPAAGEAPITSSARASVLAAISEPIEACARIATLSGTVMIRRAGAKEAFPLGDDREARRGDVVVTMRGSRAMVELADGSTLMVAEDSEVAIGAPSGLAERIELLRGRFYAWIEKQREEMFAVKTAYGFACVVGTEFDLQADREGNLALVVTEGQVNFRPTSPNAVEVALRRNEMLEHRSTSMGSRRLSAREVTERTRWARAPRRGGVNGILVGIVALALVGGAIWYFVSNGDKPASAITPITNATSGSPNTSITTTAAATPAAADTFNLFSIDPKGERSRAIHSMVGELPGLGNVEQNLTFYTETDPAAGKIRITVEDASMKRPDGSLVTGPADSYSFMKGLVITGDRIPGGQFSNFVSGRPDATGSDSFAVLMTGIQMNSLPADHAGLKPGDEWKQEIRGAVPDQPDATYEVESEFKFDGFQGTGEDRVAVVSSTVKTHIKGAAINRQISPTYTRSVVADRMLTTTTMKTYYEPSNSHMISATLQASTQMEISMVMVVKGQTPIIQKLPAMSQLQNGTMSVEYLK